MVCHKIYMYEIKSKNTSSWTLDQTEISLIDF